MSLQVSSNYRQLEGDEIARVAAATADAWKDPSIPMRQWIMAARGELERFKAGEPSAPFDALIRALRTIPQRGMAWTLLDVGASSGFYSDVIKHAGLNFHYLGLDYSPAYKQLAEQLYPGIQFEIGDARALPFPDNSFGVVLSGCVMLHVLDYEKVIAETARVAYDYAIFHRTPIRQQTTYFEKTAYGVPCLEIHFGREELLDLFDKYNLQLIYETAVFEVPEEGFSHRTFLARKR